MSVGSVTRIARDGIVHIEWKIPKFFDQMFKHQYLISPIFSFKGEKWNINIDLEDYDNVCLWFLKLDNSSDAIQVSVTLGVKQKEDSVFKSYDNDCLFKDGDDSWSSPIFPKSELIQSKDLVAPDGVLVIFLTACILHSSPGNAAVETACQTSGHTTPHGFEKVSKDFKELFLSKSEGDVIFNVKEKKFSAHKLVLTTRSSVFRAMFQADMIEKNKGTVDISDFDPDDFEKFLLYVYSGDLEVVSSSNASELYMLADKYNLKELKETCCGCLARDISLESFCDVTVLAYLHGETELLEAATNFFIKHAKIIVPTPKWTLLMAEHSTLASELLVKMTNKFCK